MQEISEQRERTKGGNIQIWDFNRERWDRTLLEEEQSE